MMKKISSHKDMNVNNVYKLLIVICTLFCSLHSTASVSTLTIDEKNLLIYSTENTALAQRAQSDLFNFNSLVESSLLSANELKLEIGDIKALNFITALFKSKDSRAPVALANYIKRYPNDALGFQLAAIELFSQQKYQEATLALRSILQSNPNYTPAHTLLGITWLMLNENEKGIEQLKQSLTAKQADPLATRYLAWDALRHGDPRQAAMYLQRSLKTYGIPTTSASLIHLELAELYRQAADFSSIIPLFKLLAQNSKTEMSDALNLEAISRLFEAATEMADINIAKMANDKLKGTAAYTSFPSQISRARLLGLESEFTKAISLLESLKSENPEMDRRRILELAKIYALKGEANASFKMLETYIASFGEQLTPNAIREYVQRSVPLGKGNQALSYLKKVYSEHPKNASLGSVLVETQLQANDLVGAQSTLNNILRAAPNFAPAYYQRGIILYNLGENENATVAFRRSLELDPHNSAVWLALMGSLHDHRTHSHTSQNTGKDHESLLPVFDEAIEKNPDSAVLYYEKGITAYSGGELNTAQVAFTQSLKLSPFDLPSLVMSIIVRADQDIDLAYAQKLSDVLVTLAPENAAVQDAIGWLKIKSNKPQEGLENLQSALKGMHDDAAVLFHMAVGYQNLNNIDSSVSYILQALRGELPAHLADSARQSLNTMRPADEQTLQVNQINGFGVGDKLGTISLKNTPDGLKVTAQLNGLPPGNNGMHFHLKPTCEAGFEGEKRIAGLAAGGHYGHDHMMMGMDMNDSAHMEHMKNTKPKGDLPPLLTNNKGNSSAIVYGSKLTLAELRGRSLMIHNGPDQNGESGVKIACAIID
jgi:Cu-Zn family superoxide dismutase